MDSHEPSTSLADLWRVIGKKLGIVTEEDAASAEIVRLAAADGEFEVEVARSGTFRAMDGSRVKVTPTLLSDLAATFDPAVYRPYSKLGHPDASKTDTPAHGPVTGLRYDPARERLLAKVDPDPELRQAIREKRFTERSMEFTKNYRESGKPRFLGLGWLGATAPAIDGLAALASGLDTDGTISVMALGKEAAGDGEPEDLVYYFRQFTADQRKGLAKEGKAMPDGSFPIENQGDLENAIQAIGRASDPAAAKAHIIKRARAMGMMDMLPADWPGSTKSKAAAAAADQEDVTMGDENAVALAEIQKQKEDLGRRLKNAAEAQATAFFELHKSRIPMAVLKAGARELFVSLAERQETATVKLSDGGDGEPVELSEFDALSKLLASLPPLIAENERRELAATGPDDGDEGVPLEFAGGDRDSVDRHLAAVREISTEKAKGAVLSYLDAVRRIETTRARK